MNIEAESHKRDEPRNNNNNNNDGGTLVTRMQNDDEMKEEETMAEDDDDDVEESTPSSRRRQDPPTSSSAESGVDNDVITVPILPTGEIVDAKNTAQSYSVLAAAQRATTNNDHRTTKPPHIDDKLSVASQPSGQKPTSSLDIPTANVVIANSSRTTSNDVFVDAQFLPPEEDEEVGDGAAVTTHGTAAASTTSLRCRLGLMILIVVLLLGGIVFGAFCASNSCFSSSSSSNVSPLPAPPNIVLSPVPSIIPFPTFQPTERSMEPTPALDERTAQIVAYMNNITLSGRTISGPYDVNHADYILERALNWLIFDDPLQLSPDTPSNQFRMRQRYALRTLWVQRTTAGEETWINGSGWLTSSANECQWYGISCQSIWLGSDVGHQNAVTRIDLVYISLNGILPADLGLFSSLSYIDIRGSNLKGTLPNSIGNWQNVTYVDLAFNQLTGTIPDSIGNWQSVTEVYLNDNELTGSLPTSIANWRNLTEIQLTYNQLTGTFPNSIGTAWTNLEYGFFFYTNFTGTVPIDWCQLTNLNTLEADCLEVTCNCCSYCY